MRACLWVVVAGLGFGLMLWSFHSRARRDLSNPWAAGFIVIGPEEPGGKRLTGRVIRAHVRLLPGNERAEVVLRSVHVLPPVQLLSLQGQLRPKLIELPLAEAGIGQESLQSGRLPEAGADEVLAGPADQPRDQLAVGERTLTVVGVLKRDFALFKDCFLIPRSESARGLFPSGDPAVHPALLVGLSAKEVGDHEEVRHVEEAYPSAKFALVTPMERLKRRTYYRYLSGQAVLLLGGSGALIGLYRWLAGRVGPSWLAAPFLEMQRRPIMVWAVHLSYFGLVILAAVFVYELPEVQSLLLTAVRAQLGSSSGPLGVAGKAYATRSIPLAAAVTFLVNYPFGSVVCITLPSLIVPGSGAIVAAIRAFLWGFILAPTFVWSAGAMLPHSFCLLLEGEGYLLATLFGAFVPIYLVDPSQKGTLLERFRRAVLLNIQANALVAMVLIVAACYEAVEVILLA
jgi:hypothetical protein